MPGATLADAAGQAGTSTQGGCGLGDPPPTLHAAQLTLTSRLGRTSPHGSVNGEARSSVSVPLPALRVDMVGVVSKG